MPEGKEHPIRIACLPISIRPQSQKDGEQAGTIIMIYATSLMMKNLHLEFEHETHPEMSKNPVLRLIHS